MTVNLLVEIQHSVIDFLRFKAGRQSENTAF